MAVFGSLLFNRTLKQFLACDDLKGAQGKALIEKINQSAKDFIQKILETIPSSDPEHSKVLKQICQKHLDSGSEDEFFNSLDDDTSLVRAASKSILSESQQINPIKLLSRLHEDHGSNTEVIDIIEFQKERLPPEVLIKNAFKLKKSSAIRLIKIAETQAERVDMSALSIDPETLDNPDIKIVLIRFLATANQPESAKLLCKFLGDKSKIITMEALKNLKSMSVSFDPSPVIRVIQDLGEEESRMGFDIITNKITPDTLPALTVLMTGKSDYYREESCKIVVKHVDEENLEKLLLALDVHEWWGKEQATKCLLSCGNENLFTIAIPLVKHSNEYVKQTAEQLSVRSSSVSGDASKSLTESLFHDNWQIREQAIKTLGDSGQRPAIVQLEKVIRKYPESSVAALKAVTQLGFSKGIELAAMCLKMQEATIQREALLTIKALVPAKHASKVRDGIVAKVSTLQAIVRDTALEVVNEITEKYKLPAIDLDQDGMFETRLLKIEANNQPVNQAASVATQTEDIEKTQVVSFQNIEELAEGDYWVDRYKIQKEIGRGAMGRVMLVEDETVGETLILKFMHPELTSDGQARERFLRELKYSRKISHQNVIRIHDFIVSQGISAISMEYFESHGLDQMIKKKLLSSHKLCLNILYQVSEGMLAAHQQEVIHRDLKPSNILVNDDKVAKVVDFGIASATSESEATLTKTGMIIGTPAYLSPERALGQEADLRSDIYALGIIAYAMFSGRPPYRGEPMSLLFQHIEGKAVPLVKMDVGVKLGISLLVEKMMATDIEDRFQTMGEVRDAIEQLL